MQNTPIYEKLEYERIKNTDHHKRMMEMTSKLHPIVYRADNYFAYNIDTKNDLKICNNAKSFNFVPTYDKWCLYCDDRNAENKKKCSKCKAVFFCNITCQKKSWKIHKKHCGRDLFGQCISCGIPVIQGRNVYFKCPDCPVKFCSLTCKNNLYKAHQDFDCKYFAETFGPKYLDYN